MEEEQPIASGFAGRDRQLTSPARGMDADDAPSGQLRDLWAGIVAATITDQNLERELALLQVCQ